MGKQIYSNKFMLTETYKAVSSQFSFARVHKMRQTAYKQGMLAWDLPTNYVIIWSCLLVKNKVMPSFGITTSQK